MSRRHVDCPEAVDRGTEGRNGVHDEKMGVFEVVDEKECYDNSCKLLILKWVHKMKGEQCRSR